MPRLTPHQERQVAVEAGCDPRTVDSYLRGMPTTSTNKARIDAALDKLGLSPARLGTVRGDVGAGGARRES